MEICSICGRDDERASGSNPNVGMLWSDDKQAWQCQSCNHYKATKVLTGDFTNSRQSFSNLAPLALIPILALLRKFM